MSKSRDAAPDEPLTPGSPAYQSSKTPTNDHVLQKRRDPTSRTTWAARIGIMFCLVLMVAMMFWYSWPLYLIHVKNVIAQTLAKPKVNGLFVGALFVFPFIVAGFIYYATVRFTSTNLSVADNQAPTRWLNLTRPLPFFPNIDRIDLAYIIVFIAIQISCLVGKVKFDAIIGKLERGGYLKSFAHHTGLNGLCATIFSIWFVCRSSFLHKFLSLSAERSAKYHVWTSNFSFIIYTLHGILYFVHWGKNGTINEKFLPCSDCSERRQSKNLRNFAGMLSYVPLAIVFLCSLERVRRVYFAGFSIVHWLNILFVLFGCMHYHELGYWLLAGTSMYLFYRLVSFTTRRQSNVLSYTNISNHILQLELHRDASSTDDFRPGQYVYLRNKSISQRWHPFTISSSPLRNKQSFQVDIKVQNGFTKSLLELMKNNTLTTMEVDGYYGSEFTTGSHLVLIGGGSGMTPFLSLLEHLVCKAEGRDTTCESNEVPLPESICVVWTTRDRNFIEDYSELLQKVAQNSNWQSEFHLHVTPNAKGDSLNENQGIQRQYPIKEQKLTFSASLPVSRLTLFLTTSLGAAGSLYIIDYSVPVGDYWYVEQLLLMIVAVCGALLCSGVALFLSTFKNEKHSSTGDYGQEELGYNEFSTPVKSTMTQTTSKLPENFTIVETRPNIESILSSVHKKVKDQYGSNVDADIYICGPEQLQTSVSVHASKLSSPDFALHKKSFAV